MHLHMLAMFYSIRNWSDNLVVAVLVLFTISTYAQTRSCKASCSVVKTSFSRLQESPRQL
jgi:hypothetical protein